MRDDAFATGYPSLGGARQITEASHVSAWVESTRDRRLGATALGVLRDLDIPERHVGEAEDRAALNGTDIASELIAARHVAEPVLFAAMAEALALPLETVSADETIVAGTSAPTPANVIRTCGSRLDAKFYIAPKLEQLGILERTLRRSAGARARMRLTTPRDLRRRHAAESEAERLADARLSLSADRPDRSARQVMTGLQGAVLASLAIAALLWAYHDLSTMILVLHIASGAIFFAPTSLRLAAALSPPRRKPPPEPEDGARRPVYSILVALRQEDEVVGHLVRWLAALEWPRSKLEVFLVCEADDPDTIHAAREAIANEPGFEVVVVPVAQPRTKPKALNFALPLAAGEFVVLFDAEDRPHPGQLEAAWRTFRTSDRRLACLQAELTIGNGRESWLSSLFAVEYATLFRGFLPWLAARGLPIPLGGTSNHFRREHLLSIGGWDSHNVTEDADLGIRLCRSGFKVAMLRSSTIEDAPTETRIWHRQRTRWMKGWMQTYLVHMRDPAALYRDLGPKGFWVLQILLIGMIGSAIAHPLFLILLGKAIAIVLYGRSTDLWMDVLLGIDLLNALGGVMAAVMLAMTTIRGPDRRHLLRSLVWIYPYWTLVSLSTARAFVELAKRPHHWAKTPHGLPFQPEDDTAARTEEDHAMRLEAPTSSGPETGIEGQTAAKRLATPAA